MNAFRQVRLGLGTAMLTLAAFGPAQAVTIPANEQPTVLPGTTFAASPYWKGSIAERDIQPFNFFVRYGVDDGNSVGYAYGVSGVIESTVFRANDGTFDFVWRIALDPLGV